MEHNFRIEETSHHTYIVRSDSERFGKDAIVYESWKRNDCVDYVGSHRGKTENLRFYVIPDLKDVFTRIHKPKIEYYDTLSEAVARFNELYPQDYNGEVSIHPQHGGAWSRLTLGIDWNRNQAMDVIHVIADGNRTKRLCSDFTRMDTANTNRDILSALLKIEQSIGIDIVHEREVITQNGKWLKTNWDDVDFWAWSSHPYYQPFATQDVLYLVGIRSYYLHLHPNEDFSFSYAKYNPNTAELMETGVVLDTSFLEWTDVVKAVHGEQPQHLLECTDRLKNLLRSAEEFPIKRSQPFYAESYAYAKEHGEEERYLASMELNQECVGEIYFNLLRNYDFYGDKGLTDFAVTQLTAEFGVERVSRILAAVVNHCQGENAFTELVQQWAKGIPVPNDESWNAMLGGMMNEYQYLEPMKALVSQFYEEHGKVTEKTVTVPSLSERLAAAKEAVRQQNTNTPAGNMKSQEITL